MTKSRKLTSVLAVALIAVMAITMLAACNYDKYVFDEPEYVVSDGDTVTLVKGNATYKLLGAVPSGVSVSDKGQFTISDSAPNGAQVVLAAQMRKTIVATAVCQISVPTVAPEIEFLNLSSYVTDGELIRAKATPVYSVSYSLKNHVSGIVIDEVSGRVNYRGNVSDSVEFTVVATSKGVSEERTFKTATTDLITIVNQVEFSEYQVGADLAFTLDFGSNTEVESQGVLGVELGGAILSSDAYTYDAAAHTLTVAQQYLATLGSGEHTLYVNTAKNTAMATVKVANFVRTAEDLAAIGQSKEALSGYYVMVNDIDLTDYLEQQEPNTSQVNRLGWYPIGTYSESDDGVPNTENAFTGHFDGNGHTISGLFMNRYGWQHTEGYNCGLFGYVSTNGIIENLGVQSKGLESDVEHVSQMNHFGGGLVGYNCGTISNCWTDVNVIVSAEHRMAGGLCGKNEGEITNCYSTGFVTAGSILGAFCGQNLGTITNCYAVDDPTNPVAHSYYIFAGRPDVLPFVSEGSVTNCLVFTSVDDMIANADFSAWSGWIVQSGMLPQLPSKTIL